MTADLHELSATQIAEGVRARRFTATAVAEAFLGRIEALNPQINAYTLVTADRALAEAARVDAAVAAGEDPGPLAGAPYGVKNLFDLEGEVTIAGSKINRDDPPAADDATLVARLAKAGAVCLGATNMGEYAYDFVTINAHDGATRNPHDLSRSAGGSSGGSGAAVAAGLAAFTLGTDTNGSVRVPSSFCGVWGLKPTYNLLSRAGVYPFVASLDTVGTFARSVADLARSLDVMAGADPRDPDCGRLPVWPSEAELDLGAEGIRVATLGGYFARGWTPSLAAAIASVAEALDAGPALELPRPDIARGAAFTITAAEAGEFHRRRLSARAADFDPGSRDRFIAGLLAPAAWYLKAQRFREWWKGEVARVFEDVDVLIAPATPMVAPGLDEQTFEFDGATLPLRANIGLFTQPITLVGLPVLAAPIHRPGQMPTAVQLIGRPNSEAILLRVARELEQKGVCAAPLGLAA